MPAIRSTHSGSSRRTGFSAALLVWKLVSLADATVFWPGHHGVAHLCSSLRSKRGPYLLAKWFATAARIGLAAFWLE